MEDRTGSKLSCHRSCTLEQLCIPGGCNKTSQKSEKPVSHIITHRDAKLPERYLKNVISSSLFYILKPNFYLVVLEVINVGDMPCQENPERSRSWCDLECVLRILREIVHVFGRSDTGLPGLMNRVGVTEKRRIPVHVNYVVEAAQRIVINLGTQTRNDHFCFQNKVSNLIFKVIMLFNKSKSETEER